MPNHPHERKLAFGRTALGVNVPVRVGGTGIIDGSGEPATDTVGSLPQFLMMGRTAGGVNLPVLADADGKLNIDWNF